MCLNWGVRALQEKKKIYLSIYLSICLSIYIYLYLYLSIDLYIYICVCIYIYIYIYMKQYREGKRRPNKIVFYFRLGVGLLNFHIVNHGQKDMP